MADQQMAPIATTAVVNSAAVVSHTEITASEPDEESLTHTDDKNNLTSAAAVSAAAARQ